MTKVRFAGQSVLPIFLAVLFLFPSQAEAGVFSFMTNMFGVEAATTPDEPATNSQKMPLLEAPVNSSLQMKTPAEIIIEGSALVPDGTLSNGATDLSAIQTGTSISTYKVEEGDTVSGIAKKFGISANTIIWANDLKRADALKIGQTLVILPISGVQYKVASGDTLQSIAKRFKGDIDEIRAYNDLKSDKLKIGDIVVIPDGVLPAGSVSKSPTSSYKGTITAGYYMKPIKSGTVTQSLHGNNAIDFGDSCGLPIYASASGSVIISKNNDGWNGGFGNYVVISHPNGSQTLYAHMQDTTVAVGAYVSAGQNIGFIGATGKVKGVTGCHVHFEIRNGPRNPF